MNKLLNYEPIDLCSCYEPIITPPPEQLEHWRSEQEKAEREPTIMDLSMYVTDTDGTRYFYCGDTIIKVSEHFAGNGRTMNELVLDVIQYQNRAA